MAIKGSCAKKNRWLVRAHLNFNHFVVERSGKFLSKIIPFPNGVHRTMVRSVNYDSE